MKVTITSMIMLLVAIFSVFVVMLGLQGLPDQSAAWTSVTQGIAPFILLIFTLGVVVSIVAHRR